MQIRDTQFAGEYGVAWHKSKHFRKNITFRKEMLPTGATAMDFAHILVRSFLVCLYHDDCFDGLTGCVFATKTGRRYMLEADKAARIKAQLDGDHNAYMAYSTMRTDLESAELAEQIRVAGTGGHVAAVQALSTAVGRLQQLHSRLERMLSSDASLARQAELPLPEEMRLQLWILMQLLGTRPNGRQEQRIRAHAEKLAEQQQHHEDAEGAGGPQTMQKAAAALLGLLAPPSSVTLAQHAHHLMLQIITQYCTLAPVATQDRASAKLEHSMAVKAAEENVRSRLVASMHSLVGLSGPKAKRLGLASWLPADQQPPKGGDGPKFRITLKNGRYPWGAEMHAVANKAASPGTTAQVESAARAQFGHSEWSNLYASTYRARFMQELHIGPAPAMLDFISALAANETGGDVICEVPLLLPTEKPGRHQAVDDRGVQLALGEDATRRLLADARALRECGVLAEERRYSTHKRTPLGAPAAGTDAAQRLRERLGTWSHVVEHVLPELCADRLHLQSVTYERPDQEAALARCLGDITPSQFRTAVRRRLDAMAVSSWSLQQRQQQLEADADQQQHKVGISLMAQLAMGSYVRFKSPPQTQQTLEDLPALVEDELDEESPVNTQNWAQAALEHLMDLADVANPGPGEEDVPADSENDEDEDDNEALDGADATDGEEDAQPPPPARTTMTVATLYRRLKPLALVHAAVPVDQRPVSQLEPGLVVTLPLTRETKPRKNEASTLLLQVPGYEQWSIIVWLIGGEGWTAQKKTAFAWYVPVANRMAPAALHAQSGGKWQQKPFAFQPDRLLATWPLGGLSARTAPAPAMLGLQLDVILKGESQLLVL